MNGISFQERLHIFYCNIHNPLSGLFSCPGNVRGDDTVIQVEERIIAFHRFCGNYVQSCRADFSALQRVGQILLFH